MRLTKTYSKREIAAIRRIPLDTRIRIALTCAPHLIFAALLKKREGTALGMNKNNLIG